MTSIRIIHQKDVTPGCARVIAMLPDDFVLLEPTEDESHILFLYAKAASKDKPPRAECVTE